MEPTPIHYAIALLAGLSSGIVSEIGGAGSLLSLPMLISLGLPPSVANGTNRIGVMTQYTMGYIRYLAHKPIPHKEAAILSLTLVLGTIAGACFAVRITGVLFNWIFIGVMIITILFTFFSKELTDRPDSTDDPVGHSRLVDYLVFLLLGLYCGMIQAGMAYLMYHVLVKRLHTTTQTAEAIKTYMSMIVTPFALFIFIWFGHIDWELGACVAVGGGLGGWIGEKFVERKDTRTVKRWFMVALVISVVYMLLFVQLHWHDGILYL
ncbi:sulfite exporter TauE/SafE family protein [uncultured Rikenella sp.]|uniref:sulfite exporter TauE/SafE family protein n=1 Tax=uncultured Rikenella sp. TaxID=368003 RepID=UPI002604D48A|nr:sulfite exporter TauE/SafE family protein [uncultured Rikenella sp.]